MRFSPAAEAARAAPFTMLVKCGLRMSRITMPTLPVRPVVMPRAIGFSDHPRSLTALDTRASTSAVKRCPPLTNLDTVAVETPAAWATSRMVATRLRLGVMKVRSMDGAAVRGAL
jgi:hypothetical protein